MSSPALTLSPEQEELLALMRTKGFSIKDLDGTTHAQLRDFMTELHHNRGVSLGDIARLIGNKTSGYTSWLCKQLGVPARPFEEARLKGIREKRRKYERRPFDGTDEDKAYLLGLRHGDLSVSRPWNGVVRVSTSTTHPAMVQLFRSLFEPYGHVYQSPRYKNDTTTFEWNLSTILDKSFEFLLLSRTECWHWVSKRESTLLSYLAGVLDAEGSIGIFSNGRGTSLQILVYNTNLELLRFINSAISLLGYGPLGPYLDKPKGTVTSKYKIERKKDYWKVVLAIFEQSQSLLARLPIRHQEKLERKRIALSIGFHTQWTEVGPRVRDLRLRIRQDRDAFVRLAETTYAARHLSEYPKTQEQVT